MHETIYADMVPLTVPLPGIAGYESHLRLPPPLGSGTGSGTAPRVFA